MRNFLILPTLIIIGLTSCKQTYKTAPNGVMYIKYTDNSGPKIKLGDFVSINLTARTDADSLIGTTAEQGIPRLMTLPYKPIFSGDYYDALTLMTLGDSLSVKMSYDSIFKHNTKPAAFKGTAIIYDMKVVKVIPREKMTDEQLQAKVNIYIQQVANAVKSAEPVKIQKYIADNKLNVSKTDSGLYYVINKKGNGQTAINNDTVVINYTGKLLNGKIFDTNIKADAIKGKIYNSALKYVPNHFPVGKKLAFAGWNQGLLLLNKGATATFIIPSKLAYGADGHDVIGSYTPMVFNVEVLDIIHSGAVKK